MKSKAFVFAILCMFAGYAVRAQKIGTALVDSLKNELAQKKGPERIEIMAAIATELRGNNPDSSMYLAGEALRLAGELRYERGIANAYLVLGAVQEIKHKYDSALHYTNIALDRYNKLIALASATDRRDLLIRKTRALLNIGIIFSDMGDFKASLENYDLALQLANTINDPVSIANTYNGIGNVYKAQSKYDLAIEYHKKSLQIRRHIANRKGMGDSYQNLGINYKAKGLYDQALSYFDSSLVIRNEMGDKKGLADLWTSKGNTYNLTGKYSDAINCINYGMRIRKEINDLRGIAGSYNNMGIIHYQKGNYPEALTNYVSALKIQQEIGNKKGIGDAYLNIGNVYYSLHNLAEAVKIYNDALKIREEMGDQHGVSGVYCNLGSVYVDEKKYPEAIASFEKARSIQLAINDLENAALSYMNIGNILGIEGKYKEALDNLFSALKIAQETNIGQNAADANLKIAEIYVRQNNLSRAIPYLQTGIQLATAQDNRELLKNGYELFAIVDSMQGNYKQSLQHYKNYVHYRDIIFSDSNIQSIQMTLDKFQYDRAADSVKASNEQRMMMQAEAAKARLKAWGVVAASILLISLVIFYFYRKRANDRFRLQIAEVKQEALIAQLDTHFISDTIDTINTFMEDNDNRAASEHLLKFSRLIRTVLGDSLKRSVPLQHDLDILDDYFNLAKLRFPTDHVKLKVDVAADLDPDSILIPPMILQVLTENAMQHAFTHEQGGLLQVSVYKKGTSVHCVVTDNGVGRAAASGKKHAQRQSYGTGLAEKLIGIWSEAQGAAAYSITDLRDADGNALGTKVEFSFPYITT